MLCILGHWKQSLKVSPTGRRHRTVRAGEGDALRPLSPVSQVVTLVDHWGDAAPLIPVHGVLRGQFQGSWRAVAKCQSGPWSQLHLGCWAPPHTDSGILPRAQGAPVPSSPGAAWRGQVTERIPATWARAARGHGLEGGSLPAARRAAGPLPPAQPPLPRRGPRSPRALCPRLSPQTLKAAPGALANPERMGDS